MQDFEIEFYRMDNGKCPVEDFLFTLNDKMVAKLMMGLKLLEKNGNLLREPFSKPLADGIFELRAQQGSDITRVLYFFFTGRKIIVTNGFVKKTQKTPTSEIAKAKRYRQEYLKREGQHGRS